MKRNNGRTARRAQLRRISQISERIKSGDFPNCVQMSDEMEVSLKTIKRDVEFMRDELELPIEFDRTRKGYYYTRAADKHFEATFGARAVQELVEANHAISQYVGTPIEKLMREAFQQMKQDLGLGEIVTDTFHGALSFRPFAPMKIDIKALQTVAAAVRRKRGLQFQYKIPGSGTEEERSGFPYHISCINHARYLFLYCLRDRAVQTFPVYLLRSPVMTPRHFNAPKHFDPDEYLRGRLIVAAGTENHEVIVELDAWATEVIRHRQLPAITNFIELPDRRSRVHLRLSTLEEIERWVLVLGTHATVLEPPVLRERLRAIAQELAKRYGALAPV
jgi:predicted DNA-binding transcriptional regulator YafY